MIGEPDNLIQELFQRIEELEKKHELLDIYTRREIIDNCDMIKEVKKDLETHWNADVDWDKKYQKEIAELKIELETWKTKTFQLDYKIDDLEEVLRELINHLELKSFLSNEWNNYLLEKLNQTIT